MDIKGLSAFRETKSSSRFIPATMEPPRAMPTALVKPREWVSLKSEDGGKRTKNPGHCWPGLVLWLGGVGQLMATGGV